MRKICEECNISGDCIITCSDAKFYDKGYKDAVEKAAKWLVSALNGDNIEGCKDSKQLIEDFKKVMES